MTFIHVSPNVTFQSVFDILTAPAQHRSVSQTSYFEGKRLIRVKVWGRVKTLTLGIGIGIGISIRIGICIRIGIGISIRIGIWIVIWIRIRIG